MFEKGSSIIKSFRLPILALKSPHNMQNFSLSRKFVNIKLD
jgi:hypothetical protein